MAGVATIAGTDAAFTTVAGFAEAAVPMPDMEPGRFYCPNCDAEAFPAERFGPGHVSVRFGERDRRNDVFLNGEKITDCYEVLDGYWALRGRSACSRCRENPDGTVNMLQSLYFGPYEVRRFNPENEN